MSDSFFAMGGYAGYVWSAYGVAFLVIGGLVVSTLLACKSEQERVRRLEEEGEEER